LIARAAIGALLFVPAMTGYADDGVWEWPDYDGSGSNGGSPLFDLINDGAVSGGVARFKATSATHSGDVLYSKTSGTGRAAWFEISNSSNTRSTIYSKTNGGGWAGIFESTKASNSIEALKVLTKGNGRAGLFEISDDDAGNSNAACEGRTNAAGYGVKGLYTPTLNFGYLGGSSYGCYGEHEPSDNYGYLGGASYGAYGFHFASSNYGFLGGSTWGAYGEDESSDNYGFLGHDDFGVYGFAPAAGDFAGKFIGDVDVVGTLSKDAGAFKIDHPLDPANKYLSHSFVESPDMKNIYDGVVTLDVAGEAVVALPDWFEALNGEFRYQLTCIGGFAPVFVAEEIQDNAFVIAGGVPGMKVSWQVTGIRQDAYARAHRIPVEEDKPESERGMFRHPQLYGQPAELQIAANPE
jgi:hypothetical protein